MAVYLIMVTVSSHDLLKEGRVARHWARNGREPYEHGILVEADSVLEARWIAAAMAHCRFSMVTMAYHAVAMQDDELPPMEELLSRLRDSLT